MQRYVQRFVQAANYTTAQRKIGDVLWVVIHCTAGPEYPGRALTSAKRFAGLLASQRRGVSGGSAPKASSHYIVDPSQIIQCVEEKDVAWHAPGANQKGIGIEICGMPNQTREEWLDKDSIDELELAGALTADICKRWEISRCKLTPDGLICGAKGIAGHADVTEAFHKSTHWDPGPNFPWDTFMDMVRSNP